jgi:uncharacterized protein (DUF2062 family)
MMIEQKAQSNLWQRFRYWLAHMHFRLVTIEDSPHSIALGVGIGIFFGFTPLWTLKTLLSIGVAWVAGANKVAAAISVQLHDLILPFMPAIYLWEYKIGFWVLNGHLPHRFTLHHLSFRDYIHWETFFTVGRPLLIGSAVIGFPSAALGYVTTRALVTNHRAHKALKA